MGKIAILIRETSGKHLFVLDGAVSDMKIRYFKDAVEAVTLINSIKDNKEAGTEFYIVELITRIKVHESITKNVIEVDDYNG